MTRTSKRDLGIEKEIISSVLITNRGKWLDLINKHVKEFKPGSADINLAVELSSFLWKKYQEGGWKHG